MPNDLLPTRIPKRISESLASPYASITLPRPVLQIRAQRLTKSQLRDLLVSNPHDATHWVGAAAEADIIPAQIVWGQLLLDGTRVARDPAAAFVWFERAAQSGDPDGQNMVGRCYERGWGVEPDPKLATSFFEAAAASGHVWGQVNLAQMLMRGGNPADRPRSFELFRAAAEGGTSKANLKAMNSLARFLEEGWVVPADPRGALYWYNRAAALGDHWAQYNLATILHAGGDAAGADVWLERAISASDSGFRRRIAPLLLVRSELALRRHGLEALKRMAASGNPADVQAYASAVHETAAASSDIDGARRRSMQPPGHGGADSRWGLPTSIVRCLVDYFAGRIEAISRRITKPSNATSSSSVRAL
ncbi:tetratricopeptide repeat protein [Bradyrhizobium sp. NC92]|uniref:tetratricopeptide repeat protein n=1 Tax=Bradyrhizobium sp. (strain NC92) TaxID=55395 RepID=UPI0021AA0B05|nr:tetratricopeptide repeat protein [Bradyrhizobium sp. NC92]UWU66146.1 sel1 repeat family protein [Bradyrhizobium sp. NC92]